MHEADSLRTDVIPPLLQIYSVNRKLWKLNLLIKQLIANGARFCDISLDFAQHLTTWNNNKFTAVMPNGGFVHFLSSPHLTRWSLRVSCALLSSSVRLDFAVDSKKLVSLFSLFSWGSLCCLVHVTCNHQCSLEPKSHDCAQICPRRKLHLRVNEKHRDAFVSSALVTRTNSPRANYFRE